MGHQMANSYALLLNAIVGKTEQKALPGYDPNITTASTGI